VLLTPDFVFKSEQFRAYFVKALPVKHLVALVPVDRVQVLALEVVLAPQHDRVVPGVYDFRCMQLRRQLLILEVSSGCNREREREFETQSLGL